MFKKILIANRGAIATRIERTLKKMGVGSVAIYAKDDRDSLHVINADEAVDLGEGPVADTYLNIDKVIKACKDTGAEAVHPGYGFLSENTEFAKRCEENGIKFIGPTPEQITKFGLKHEAREIAIAADVPLLPGTGLLSGVDEAVDAAEKIGYPVMLKSTAGGGGIGISICYSADELRSEYDNVRHLAETNFSDAGIFLEKYLEKARHVEVQIFGNEYGEAVAIGDRDCSVQRRNQKVVEESPAPNIPPDVRKKLHEAAERLANKAHYRSAGTVEFLYVDETQRFYFLEVNTRLQVEHGITEEVMGVDLVEWMVREAAGELKGLQEKVNEPSGHAIEVRVYAEDPYNNFRPGIGKVDDFHFSDEARVETWIRKNIHISANYDPMLAKIIVHDKDRKSSVEKMSRVLSDTKIYGVTSNLSYLHSFIDSDMYRNADLSTRMLKGFLPEENAIEVIDGGIQSSVQDYPGMIGYWTVGVPSCGAMDDFHFRLGNRLLGNDEGAPGIEMTMRGGSYKFRTTTSFCLTGADMGATLDGVSVKNNQVVNAAPGQTLTLGFAKTGMRTYLTVAGGLDIPLVMGSASTFIDGKFGGHNGGILTAGNVLALHDNCHTNNIASVPDEYLPPITNEWTIGVIPGPQPTEEYLRPEYLHTLTTSEYEVSYNSARTGIRLIGPGPEFAREDGGEAGLHPSNIHDNAYAIGSMDLTGDQPILLGPDGPSLGGFICSVTTAKSQLWKLGQLHPGDKVRFQLLTLEQAADLRQQYKDVLDFKKKKITFPTPEKLTVDYAILDKGVAGGVKYCVRLDGEENILVEFGEMELNIELRFRAHILMQELEKTDLPIIDMTPGIRSLQVHFDIEKTDARKMREAVVKVNNGLENLDDISVPSRIIYLPLSWDDPQTQLAARRYQETTRPDAPWCPSNPEFIRRINGLDSVDDVRKIVFDASYLVLGLGDVYLGAPVATPVDPRQRLVTTKYNPARPWTPENAVGIGGAYLCVYGMEGPGGYQFVGRTIQMWNPLQETEYFTKEKPWLLNFFDQIRFYPCTAEEILKYREDFLRGQFPLKIEETTFHLGEYKKWLASIHDSAAAFKAHQQASFDAEHQRWIEQGLDHFEPPEEDAGQSEGGLPEGTIPVASSVIGNVWKVLVNEGDEVKQGDEVAVLESMKMEFPVKAPCDGKVSTVLASTGMKVAPGQALMGLVG